MKMMRFPGSALWTRQQRNLEIAGLTLLCVTGPFVFPTCDWIFGPVAGLAFALLGVFLCIAAKAVLEVRLEGASMTKIMLVMALVLLSAGIAAWLVGGIAGKLKSLDHSPSDRLAQTLLMVAFYTWFYADLLRNCSAALRDRVRKLPSVYPWRQARRRSAG